MIIGDKTHSKTGTQSFYAWMKAEIKGLYSRCYDFAYEIAQKAERALQYELGNPGLNFLQYNYTAGKEGLLAGEKLYLDIKHMEMAYHELNVREYELTKHVSLRQVDPIALLWLRATGTCTFKLPEELFDKDCPGHYYRRIKQVAVSIPCVAGPYTSVNSTLTLNKSSIREVPQLIDSQYGITGVNDGRFRHDFSSMQSIVTSTGQNDTGLFDSSRQDNRPLPFEGKGVISDWQIQLPANPSENEPCQFDYDTISDVILHIRYTAREGGDPLRGSAKEHFSRCIASAEAAGSLVLYSMRHDFPTEWANFKATEIDEETPSFGLTIELRDEHYPFWSQGRLGKIEWAEAFVKTTETDVQISDTPDEGFESLNGGIPNFRTGRINPPGSPTGEYNVYLNTKEIDNLWLVLAWGSN
jgi:hypothetical protein